MSTLLSTFIIGDSEPELYSMTDAVVRPDRKMPLDDATKLAEDHPIWAQRGKAIQSYALLEQSLCSVLSALGDMSPETAATVFYKIASAGSRNAILEKLLHKKHGSRFNLFWNAFLKELRTIDIKRNEIVHWLTVTHAALDDNNIMHIGVNLVPPNFWDSPAPPRIMSKDLAAFSDKCEVFSRLCNMFSLVTKPDAEPTVSAPWLEIFQQPLIYPLPADHPLNQPPKAPDSLPPPSRA